MLFICSLSWVVPGCDKGWIVGLAAGDKFYRFISQRGIMGQFSWQSNQHKPDMRAVMQRR